MILEVLKKLYTPPLPNIINIGILVTNLVFNFSFAINFFRTSPNLEFFFWWISKYYKILTGH